MVSRKQESAVVTGAASGIGREAALALARRGAAVALLDRDGAKAQVLADEIAGAGGRAIAVATDVTDSAQVKAAIDKAAAAHGGLDTVVAAAGIALTGSVLQMAEADWHRTIAVNLTGPYLTARHAVPHLLERGGGSYVAISSDAGIRGSMGFAAYCASKHAVMGLVRCLALDHGHQGIRSNEICPSFVDTPMADQLLADGNVPEKSFYERRVPLGRFAQAAEVARVILHLTSAEASYTNGMYYVIDGGTTAGTYTAAPA